jgi:hypothetical protein
MTLCRAANCFLACLLFFLVLVGFSFTSSPAQSLPHRERLRGVLSRTKLAPEMHGSAVIRYSPDGKALFVQDAAGVMLLSRNPVQLVSYIDAPYTYPARFSADCKTLTIVSFDLYVSGWSVSDAKKLDAFAAFSLSFAKLAADPSSQVTLMKVVDSD